MINISILILVTATSYSQEVTDTCTNDEINSDYIEKIMNSADLIDVYPVFKPENDMNFKNWLNLKLNQNGLIYKCPLGMNVNVHFTITSTGKVIDILIEKQDQSLLIRSPELSVGCRKAIMDLFVESEKYWTGGSYNGKPISVRFSIPIIIKR